MKQYIPKFHLLATFAALLVSVLTIAGCATLERNQSSAKLVTQYAVLKYAERMPAEQRPERLERVRKIVGDVRALAAGSASLVTLRAAVDAELERTNLSPADRLLAAGLLDMLGAELTDRIGAGLLSPEQLVQVTQVLDWIEQATRLAG